MDISLNKSRIGRAILIATFLFSTLLQNQFGHADSYNPINDIMHSLLSVTFVLKQQTPP